jgi:phosphoglycerate dehydrogenase-like enzyme
MMTKIRVGYPATLEEAAHNALPSDVEFVPLEDGLDREVEVEVWIPDPYQTRARRIWPWLRGVRLVLSLMAGTEWIPATVGPHVTICNAHGAHNISTAEWTVSAILAMLKQFPLFLDIQRSAEWRRRKEAAQEYAQLTGDTRQHHPDVMLEELTGKAVLLVGYGAIGQEIERMLTPFDVELIRVARTARAAPRVHPVGELDSLLPQADVVILILPLTEESRGLIGARQFEQMRQGALVVNSARGAIVQTDALVNALNQGKVRAALDVTDPEPLPLEHPLWRCPNLLITPHVAGSSPQFARRAFAVAAAELRRYFNGEPLHNVVQLAS